MILDSKHLVNISESDLKTLINDGVPEGKMIDYKRDLPGGTDAEKKEFLFDVDSFANASGGFLLYGVEEKAGIPHSLSGVILTNIDAEMRKLESMIIDSIDPRIYGLEFHHVPLSNSKSILLIHIPKSWTLPHMVTFKGTDKFYSRNSAGKYRLDVGELRILFGMQGNIAEKARRFRAERLAQIIADEGPHQLGSLPKIILHIVPVAGLSSPLRIDLRVARTLPSGLLTPLATSGFNSKTNLDGILNYSPATRINGASYLQLFESGFIETVNAEQLTAAIYREVADIASASHRPIPSASFEQKLIEQIPAYLTALQKLGMMPPILILLALTGVKGFYMAGDGRTQIDRDVLLVPELLLEQFDARPIDLRPLLDPVWRASGMLESPNFDERGIWDPTRVRGSSPYG